MHVRDVDSLDTERALRAMVLANDAEETAGDPLELALLEYAAKKGVDPADFARRMPRRSVLPFDSSYKFMRVTVEEDGQTVSYLKGAPEVLLKRCRLSREEKQSWEEKAEGYAVEGFRVLALAWRTGEGDDELSLLGLVLLWDPPRKEVPEAIRQALAAGIRVVMVTGDHPATAVAVANEVGIPPGRVMTGLDLETLSAAELSHAVKEVNVFARVAPRDKLRLVEASDKAAKLLPSPATGYDRPRLSVPM